MSRALKKKTPWIFNSESKYSNDIPSKIRYNHNTYMQINTRTEKCFNNTIKIKIKQYNM